MSRKKGTRVKKAVNKLLDKTTVDEKIILSLRNKIDLATKVLAEDLRKWLI